MRLGFLALGLAMLASAAACWGDGDPDEESALRFAAEKLCSKAPEEVLDDLLFARDSGVIKIYVKGAERTVSFVILGLHSSEPDFGPLTREAFDYQESMPDTCFDVRPIRATPTTWP